MGKLKRDPISVELVKKNFFQIFYHPNPIDTRYLSNLSVTKPPLVISPF